MKATVCSFLVLVLAACMVSAGPRRVAREIPEDSNKNITSSSSDADVKPVEPVSETPSATTVASETQGSTPTPDALAGTSRPEEQSIEESNAPKSSDSGSESAVTEAPSSNATGSDASSSTPDSDAPGSDAPRPDAPGPDAPGPDAPVSDAPGPDAPGSDGPGSNAPEANGSKSNGAELEEPAANTVERSASGTTTTDSTDKPAQVASSQDVNT